MAVSDVKTDRFAVTDHRPSVRIDFMDDIIVRIHQTRYHAQINEPTHSTNASRQKPQNSGAPAPEIEPMGSKNAQKEPEYVCNAHTLLSSIVAHPSPLLKFIFS